MVAEYFEQRFYEMAWYHDSQGSEIKANQRSKAHVQPCDVASTVCDFLAMAHAISPRKKHPANS